MTYSGNQTAAGGDGYRVILVAETVSLKMGGEAARPFRYFEELLSRGVDVHLVTHERTSNEFASLPPERLHLVADNRYQRGLAGWVAKAPDSIARVIFFGIRVSTQFRMRKVIRNLVKQVSGKAVVHEPIPISPKEPSLMFGLGAPVLLGPLNGDMNYPPEMRSYEPLVDRVVIAVGRVVAQGLNLLIPGKRKARVVLVSNDRTRRALPWLCDRDVRLLVANAVDLAKWSPKTHYSRTGPVTFSFLGRLVAFKGVDLLIEAFHRVAKTQDLKLLIVGDGPEREALEKLAGSALHTRIQFAGWLEGPAASEALKSSDIFAFPSLMDPGGAVIMEAMCLGLPIIALAWGGPADYCDPECGILIPTGLREEIIDRLARAMETMIQDAGLREQMGRAGRAKAEREFSWSKRVNRLQEIYQELSLETSARR